MDKRDKPHIKHARFSDSNISSLEDHKRVGKKLKSPFSELGNLQLSSWYNDFMPNIMWACLLATSLERDVYLTLFRRVVVNARTSLEGRKDSFITHNFMSLLSGERFDVLLAPVLALDQAKSALAPLRLLDSLPDRDHWARVLPDVVDPGAAWSSLARAVLKAFNHQSQPSTDVRWFKLSYLIFCREGMFFDGKLAERLEEIRLYPDKGDMRSVRPFIRATEMTIRPIEAGTEETRDSEGKAQSKPPALKSAEFWSELMRKTRCRLLKDDNEPKPGSKELRDEVLELHLALAQHFDATNETTAPDPRHDAAFGLVLYALNLLFGCSVGYNHNFIEGRMVLRSVVEALITFRYLLTKDQPALWLAYRQHGSGQAKLAFLKNLREDNVPDFIDLDLLEFLANEDTWIEYQDVNLGNWANINLRRMAEEGKVKNVYDKHYDWASGYAHGHWVCVRDSVFVNCFNPLHRFHRVPGPPKVYLPSVLVDASKLINGMLDDLNQAYPTFKPRLMWHKSATSKSAEEGTAASKDIEELIEDVIEEFAKPPIHDDAQGEVEASSVNTKDDRK